MNSRLSACKRDFLRLVMVRQSFARLRAYLCERGDCGVRNHFA